MKHIIKHILGRWSGYYKMYGDLYVKYQELQKENEKKESVAMGLADSLNNCEKALKNAREKILESKERLDEIENVARGVIAENEAFKGMDCNKEIAALKAKVKSLNGKVGYYKSLIAKNNVK